MVYLTDQTFKTGPERPERETVMHLPASFRNGDRESALLFLPDRGAFSYV